MSLASNLLSDPTMSRCVLESSVRGSFELRGELVRVGRVADADLVISESTVSRQQAELRQEGGDWVLVPLSATVATLVNDDRLDAPHRLISGDVVHFGAFPFTFRAFASAPPVPRTKAPDTLEAEPTFGTLLDTRGLGDLASAQQHRLWVRESGVLGRSHAALYQLDHPMVSARHAEVVIEGRRVGLRDLGSTNGTFVDGERLEEYRALTGGERIDVGPFLLEFTGDAFLVATRRGNAQVVARDLVRSIGDKRILDGVSLVIEPSELVALIGPSGSGKSTLLRALGARTAADSGSVTLNGVPLNTNFEALKRGIAMIPQREMLHEALTLREALEYTAQLRLPSDTPALERSAAVERALAEVELTPQADTRIGDLSGGQKKRAALANETLSAPHVCLADEVTSGLDEETDREIMRLIRRQADGGMTVIVVTHTLANIEEFCHKLAILGVGGVLLFYGTPREALQHFGVARLCEVYDVMRRVEPRVLRARFDSSEFHRRHVAAPLARDAEREQVSMPKRDASSAWRRDLGEFRAQVGVLTSRALKLYVSDRQALWIALGQSALVAVVLALVFAGMEGAAAPARAEFERSLLFLIGVSCLWFGCNNASKEIVKERGIYTCERDVNLSVPAYLGAKLSSLMLLGAGQAVILFTLLTVFVGVPGPSEVQLTSMVLAVFAGTCMGLLVSALARTPDQATTAVPILLIPQIVMGGRIVEDLPGVAEFLARIAVSGFWVFRAFDSALDSGARSGAVINASALLLMHAAVYIGAALAALLLREKRSEGVYWTALTTWTRSLLRSARGPKLWRTQAAERS